jgi:hypothetical protein
MFGFEKEIAKRMAWWEELRKRAAEPEVSPAADAGNDPERTGGDQ